GRVCGSRLQQRPRLRSCRRPSAQFGLGLGRRCAKGPPRSPMSPMGNGSIDNFVNVKVTRIHWQFPQAVLPWDQALTDIPMDVDKERNRLTARVQRYGRVGANVGGVAARIASARLLGLDPDREAAALASALGGLKGPIMKVAQLLATIPEALPAEYAAELG